MADGSRLEFFWRRMAEQALNRTRGSRGRLRPPFMLSHRRILQGVARPSSVPSARPITDILEMA